MSHPIRILRPVGYEGGTLAVGAIVSADLNENGHAYANLPDGRKVSVGQDEFVWLDFSGFYQQSFRLGCAAFMPEADRDIIAAIDRYIDAKAEVQTAVWSEALSRLAALLPDRDTLQVLDRETAVLRKAADKGADKRQMKLRGELIELRKVLDEAFTGPAARILGGDRVSSARTAGAIAALDEAIRLVPDVSDIPF